MIQTKIQFDTENQILHAVLAGKMNRKSLEIALKKIYRSCEENSLDSILIDLTNLNRFAPEGSVVASETFRSRIAEKFIDIFKRRTGMIFGVISKPKWYNGFSEYLIQSSGLILKVFSNKEDALHWLTEQSKLE